MPTCCVNFKGFKVKIVDDINFAMATEKKPIHTWSGKWGAEKRTHVCWLECAYALHVKCCCQKEHFMCIYVIIKIAQLVTHDDYAIRNEWRM